MPKAGEGHIAVDHAATTCQEEQSDNRDKAESRPKQNGHSCGGARVPNGSRLSCSLQRPQRRIARSFEACGRCGLSAPSAC